MVKNAPDFIRPATTALSSTWETSTTLLAMACTLLDFAEKPLQQVKGVRTGVEDCAAHGAGDPALPARNIVEPSDLAARDQRADQARLAERSRLQKSADSDVGGNERRVLGNAQRQPTALGERYQLRTFLAGRRHRFLEQDVLACLKGGARHGIMEMVGQGSINCLHRRVGKEFSVVGIGLRPEFTGDLLGNLRVLIADSHYLSVDLRLLEPMHVRTADKSRSDQPKPNLSVAQLVLPVSSARQRRALRRSRGSSLEGSKAAPARFW